MARHERHTEPVETRDGWISNYYEIEPQLIQGEVRGRQWLLEPARGQPDAEQNFLGPAPTDGDILRLHQVMFGDLYSWAGKTRKNNAGPAWKVPVEWSHVRQALRDFTRDLECWVTPLRIQAGPLTVAQMGVVMARAHHRFQYIHPFQDTNGRTGRVFDHFLLWVTFAQGRDSLEDSPILAYFPSEASEEEYYEGLREADDNSPERLECFYISCLECALEDN